MLQQSTELRPAPKTETSPVPLPEPVTVRKPIYRRPVGIALMLAVLLGAICGTAYWLYARQWEETDYAFIDGNIYPVGTKVAGAIQSVRVADNQFVNAGDVLAQIDPRDIQARLAQSKAS